MVTEPASACFAPAARIQCQMKRQSLRQSRLVWVLLVTQLLVLQMCKKGPQWVQDAACDAHSNIMHRVTCTRLRHRTDHPMCINPQQRVTSRCRVQG